MSEESQMLADFLKAKNSKDLWYNFESKSFEKDSDIRTMISEGKLSTNNVSSIPDIFPIFGDMDLAVEYYLPILVETAKGMVDSLGSSSSESPPGTPRESLTLHKGLYGFHNPKEQTNYCFMDSILIAMFSLQRSPFYTRLIEKDYIPNGEIMCGKNANQDAEIRTKIQTQLRQDVATLIKGKARYTCSTLRKLIGRDCRLSEAEEDMSQGTHDASQLYGRLLRAMNYMPLTIVEYQETITSDGNWLPATDQRPVEETHLRIPVTNIDRISWPETWNNNVVEEKDLRGDFMKVCSKIDIVKAEVLVVHVERAVWNQEEERIDMNTKTIHLDQSMKIDFTDGTSRIFILQAVVYAPYYGHYNCMIKSQGKWYDYDDTNTKQTIEMRPLATSKAIDIASRRGSVLFYF